MDKLCLKKLINEIDMKNINIKMIKSNVKYLIGIFKNMKKTWLSIEDYDYKSRIKLIEQNTNEYGYIRAQVELSSLMEYEVFKMYINNNKNLLSIGYDNIELYYLYNKEYKNDLDEIIKLLKITICINKLYFIKDNEKRIIIWIPIPKQRDFNYNEINVKNLNKSYNNYGAFTVSGLTYINKNNHITIISRYEEIEKLLIHELIHNFKIDGSNYYHEFKDIIKKYDAIKNKKNRDNIINYNYKYSIYESYSELAGTYLVLLINNINVDNDKLEDKLLSNIIIELLYSYNTIVNIAKLNKYENWNDFIKSEIFYGNICIYEYYYLKGLLYNNFNFRICNKLYEFISLYNDIINVMDKSKYEKLLIDIYTKSIRQTNYKYMILN